MWIMVSGPYTTGAKTPEQRAANLRLMNEAAHEVFRRGHIPVIGVNAALPIIEAAGGTQEAYDRIMMPIAFALVDRCDACLRIGGPSKGSDDEVARFEAAGKPVYRRVEDVPGAT